MPSGFDTVCLASAGGVATADLSGCSTAYSLEGKYRMQITSFENQLIAARDAVINGGSFRFGGGTATPQQTADDMAAQPGEYCKFYPGACPADAVALANTYIGILRDMVGSYGFDMSGHYIGGGSPMFGDAIFAEDVVTTPIPHDANVMAYNPSAGWVAPTNSLPVVASPTIPAFTSPSNVAATSPGSVTAAGGGTNNPGSAAGTGSTVTAGTRIDRTTPTVAQATSLAGVAIGTDSKMLMILLAVAVAVIVFGRK